MAISHEVLDDYATPGPGTDPSGYVSLVRELPAEPTALAQAVRRLLSDEEVVALRKLTFPPGRLAARERLGAEFLLEGVLALSLLPICSQRTIEERMVFSGEDLDSLQRDFDSYAASRPPAPSRHPVRWQPRAAG